MTEDLSMVVGPPVLRVSKWKRLTKSFYYELGVIIYDPCTTTEHRTKLQRLKSFCEEEDVCDEIVKKICKTADDVKSLVLILSRICSSNIYQYVLNVYTIHILSRLYVLTKDILSRDMVADIYIFCVYLVHVKLKGDSPISDTESHMSWMNDYVMIGISKAIMEFADIKREAEPEEGMIPRIKFTDDYLYRHLKNTDHLHM